MGLYLRYWRPGKVLEVLADRLRAGARQHLRRRVGRGTRRRSRRGSRCRAMALAIAIIMLRLLRQRAAGVAAARAARLPEHVRQARRGADARRRHPVRAAGAAAAGVHAVHRRHRSDLRRQDLPVLLHHHRLRRDLRLPLADLVGHHAEDDRARVARAAGRLRLDAARELRRHHGDDRRLRAAAGRLLRGQLAGRRRRRHARGGGGDDHRLGLSR